MSERAMMTHDDLNWWLETATKLDWIWAKTYADTAPHEYVVEGRTSGLARHDYVRAGRIIHTFGRPAKFYGMTNIYLTSPDGRVKWWTMDADVAETGLINQATTQRLYGVQNAPVTKSGTTTPYDMIATSHDADHPTNPELAQALQATVTDLSNEYRPAILDVGCGTGRVLDMGLTTPDRYAGVDPSTPMLNQLVRKHPGVGRLYPMTIEQAIDGRIFTPGQFEIVTVLVDDADHFSEETLAAVRKLASRAFIRVVGHRVEVHLV